MTGYQVGLLGKPGSLHKGLKATLERRLAELGIDTAALSLMTEADIRSRDRKSPFIGVFVGYPGANDGNHPILPDLIEDSVVIIPCVSELSGFRSLTPESLHRINGFELDGADHYYDKLCSLILENFRLLRSDRRLFISYKRTESQRIAIQLYEKLDALGFDVFLDTRGVPPGEDFQSVLWHRLADSDVVVLLDTPGFRESRWTREELARANATNIQILHVLWPDRDPDNASAFSQFHELTPADFVGIEQIGPEAALSPEVTAEIGVLVERLRARALAARHQYLVDNFCDQARMLGKAPTVQVARFISLELSPKNKIAVVPTIGVPNATRYQDIEAAIMDASNDFSKIWLIYDERGILDTWLKHVDWLNEHLPLSAVRVSESSRHIREASP